MKLIIECKPHHRLTDLTDVKLALLELGYDLTISPAGDLVNRDTLSANCRPELIAISSPRPKPIWPPRKLRAAP